MTQALLDFILGQGTKVMTSTEIQRIDPENHTIADANGNLYNYRQLIWAADQKRLYDCVQMDQVESQKVKDLVGEKRKFLEKKKGNNSVLTLYLSVDLDPDYFREISTAHLFYTPSREGQIKAGRIPLNKNWEEMQAWLARFFTLTTYEVSIPVLRDSSMAPKGKTGLIISMLFDYTLTKQIQDMGKYEEFKRFAALKMTEILDRTVFPGIVKSVSDQFMSTPLTLEQITGNSQGAITGWAFTNHPFPAENRLARIAKAVKTPLPDISQAGQWTISPSGFPIALITGKLAADTVQRKLK